MHRAARSNLLHEETRPCHDACWLWGAINGDAYEERVCNGLFSPAGTLCFKDVGIRGAVGAALSHTLMISLSSCRTWLKVGRVEGSARQQARPRSAYWVKVLRGNWGRRPCLTWGNTRCSALVGHISHLIQCTRVSCVRCVRAGASFLQWSCCSTQGGR
jgi:hypothetical protein